MSRTVGSRNIPNTKGFSIGMRVVSTRLAKSSGFFGHAKTGTVVRFSKDGQFLGVRLDGQSCIRSYHPHFWKMTRIPARVGVGGMKGEHDR